MYSAREVINKLNNKGYDIELRKLNYYVSEKKMIELNKGKNAYTNENIDDIEKILILKKTNLKLDEIKDIIKDNSLEEIKRNYINPYNYIFNNQTSQINCATNKYIDQYSKTSIANCNFGYPYKVGDIIDTPYNPWDINNPWDKHIIRDKTTPLITKPHTDPVIGNRNLVIESLNTSSSLVKKSILIMNNEIKINVIYKDRLCDDNFIKDIIKFIKFTLNDIKEINENKEYIITNSSEFVLDSGDTIAFLNYDKYKDFREEIIDYINFKMSKF